MVALPPKAVQERESLFPFLMYSVSSRPDIAEKLFEFDIQFDSKRYCSWSANKAENWINRDCLISITVEWFVEK